MKDRVLVNIMERNKQTVIAICDESVLGKKYIEGELCLDLIKYKKFYEGKVIEDVKELKEKIKSASSINIVGKESIKLMENLGFDIKNCKYIGKEKIPHLQIYRL
ncbi:MAG: DUF424 family protein [Candidatus Micrarchaeia archaeon]